MESALESSRGSRAKDESENEVTHLQSVPNVAVVIVVTSEQDPSTSREGDRGDSTENVVVNERVELSVGSKIEESARGVVGSGSERVSVGEEPARNERKTKLSIV